MINNNKFFPPYFYYTTAIKFISCIGIIISIYLSYNHYKNYTDPWFASICAISKSINCDTVAQSKFSILFSVPLGFWGGIFYFDSHFKPKGINYQKFS